MFYIGVRGIAVGEGTGGVAALGSRVEGAASWVAKLIL